MIYLFLQICNVLYLNNTNEAFFWRILPTLCFTVQTKEINTKYFDAILNDGKYSTKYA